jgi:hypothetical protein
LWLTPLSAIFQLSASVKVYQLLAHGGLFSPGTTASSTTKTGHHDIAEILLKVALNTIKQTKSIENLNLLVRIKFLNLFLYTVKPALVAASIMQPPVLKCQLFLVLH